MRRRLFSFLTVLSKPAVGLGGALVIAAGAVSLAWQASSLTPTGQYTEAGMAPISGVGGASSDLSFQISGQIVSVPVSIGQEVKAGTTLIALDQSALLATRAGAAANLEAVQAKLASLQAGTRPEQLAIDQTAVAQANTALMGALQMAYTNADDAVHAKADQLFSNPRNSNATLTILVPDSTLVNRVQMERIALEPVFSAWNMMLSATQDNPESSAASSEANMRNVAAFLDDLTVALAKTQPDSSISATTLVGYQTSVNTGRLNVLSSLLGIISADTAYKAAIGALELAQAGVTANDIAVQKAAVDAAQAALRSIDVSLRQSMLVAPVTGTVTALNAHPGQTVVPGQIIASVESAGDSKPNALVVPTSSVIKDGGQAFVYVKSGSNVPVRSSVITGLVSADGMTEIISGLSPGQEVLTFGTVTSK